MIPDSPAGSITPATGENEDSTPLSAIGTSSDAAVVTSGQECDANANMASLSFSYHLLTGNADLHFTKRLKIPMTAGLLEELSCGLIAAKRLRKWR